MSRIAPWKANLLLLGVALIWGITFIVVKKALAGISPLAFIAIRFMAAFLFLYLVYRPGSALLARPLLLAGFVTGLFLFSGYALQTIGLMYTSASNAGFITGLAVVLVPLLNAFLTRRFPNPHILAGALLAAAGLGLLTLDPHTALQKGDLLVFFCACSFALHIIYVGRYTQSHNTVNLALLQILLVGLLSSALAFISPQEAWPVLWTKEILIALAVTAIPATALAYVIQNNIQRYTSPSRTALVFAMEPVFAALAARWLGGEILSSRAVWGAALVMAGILYVELVGKSMQRAEPVQKCSDARHS